MFQVNKERVFLLSAPGALGSFGVGSGVCRGCEALSGGVLLC